MDNTKKYNIAFFGTPELCIPYLDALRDAGFMPSLVVTQPDKAIGRKWSELQAPPVKIWAEHHDVEVLQPEKLDLEHFDQLAHTSWDLFIVVAYGKIMPKNYIHLPTHGTLNVHYSLLPRWRGATPVEAAILAGDTATGVAIQQMRYKLDSGPLIALEDLSLTGNEFTHDLRNNLTTIGAELLAKTLPEYLAGSITPQKQNPEDITMCKLTQKSDAEVSLNEEDEILWRKYRAYHGWPTIYYFDENGKRVKITEAAFENERFIIKKIIREGDKEQDYSL